MYKNILALVLLIFAAFGGGILDLLDVNTPINPEPPIAKILDIEKPDEDTINKVKQFSSLITDPTDRTKIALFSYQFSQNVSSYSANSQQVNDVFTLAGEIFFQKTLVDKYNGLDEMIVSLMQEAMGSENHILTQDEKDLLHKYFLAVSWILIQKV